MQELKLNSYQVYDPGNLAPLPFDWIPFDAKTIKLVMAIWSTIPLEEFEFNTELQSYSSFPGWRKVSSTNEVKFEEGFLVIEISVPANLNKYDFDSFHQFQNWSHRNRFRVIAKHNAVNYELLAPFTQEMFPVRIKEWTICDPEKTLFDSSSLFVPQFSGDIKKLFIGFKLEETYFSTFKCNLRITNRFAQNPTVYNETFDFESLETFRLLDPLPSGIQPPTNINSFNRYSIQMILSSGEWSRTFSKQFDILPIIPIGSIEVTDLAINRFPVFEFNEGPLVLSNNWERIIVTLKIATAGYDPVSDSSPAKAWINFFDDGKFYFRLEGKIEFLEEEEETYAFLEGTEIPPGSLSGKKTAQLYLNHNNRTYFKEINNIQFINELRADNLIEFFSVDVNREGRMDKVIALTDRTLTISYHFHGVPNDTWVNSTVVLLSKSVTRLRKQPSYDFFAVGYTRINCKGSGQATGVVTVTLPTLVPELFQRSHMAVLVFSNYKFKGLSYYEKHELNDLKVANELLMPADEKMRSRPRPQPQPQPSYPKEKLSGKHWCAKFPTSETTATLASPFKKNIQNFITMLEANGAKVKINATKRPAERAHLMHFSFKVAKKILSPSKVPKYPNIDIIWSHDNAISAAEEMVKEYNIAYPPAFKSKHVDGLAIDMTITSLPSILKFRSDNKDVEVTIGKLPAHSNKNLWRLASKYYSVAKLPHDAPHWMHEG
jgi:hypothetical protein